MASLIITLIRQRVGQITKGMPVRSIPVLQQTNSVPAAPSASRKEVAMLSGTDSFIFHYADVHVSHSSEARINWVKLARPGRKPVVARGGENLREMEISITMGFEFEPDRDIEVPLSNLRYMVAVPGPITVAYGDFEGGNWRVTDMTVDTTARRPGDQKITQAEVKITFLEDSPAPYPRPVAAAPAPPPPAPPPVAAAASAQRTYTVKKGDTLWQLAVNYYKNGNRWTEIANRNGIKDPRKLQIGTVLVIP
jgi:LysM repeat protein